MDVTLYPKTRSFEELWANLYFIYNVPLKEDSIYYVDRFHERGDHKCALKTIMVITPGLLYTAPIHPQSLA